MDEIENISYCRKAIWVLNYLEKCEKCSCHGSVIEKKFPVDGEYLLDTLCKKHILSPWYGTISVDPSKIRFHRRQFRNKIMRRIGDGFLRWGGWIIALVMAGVNIFTACS